MISYAAFYLAVILLLSNVFLLKRFPYIPLIFLAGVLAFSFKHQEEISHLKNLENYTDKYVSVTGYVVEPPNVKDDKTTVVFKVTSLDEHKNMKPFLVQITARKRLDFTTGDNLKIEGALSVTEPSDEYLFFKHVRARISVNDTSQIEDVGSKDNSLLYSSTRVINKAARARSVYLPSSNKGLFLGMLLGDISLMPQELQESFKRSGLTHLVAVSGSNIALFSIPLIFILAWLGLPRIWQFLVVIVLVTVYVFATGFQASILRASVMTFISLAGIFFLGHKTGINLLATSVLAILIADPFLLKNVGFLLSVGSTLGLLTIMPVVASRFSDSLPCWLTEAMAASLSAQIMVMPLLAYYFGEISAVSVPANIMAAPLVGPITNFGMMTILFYYIYPPVSLVFLQICRILLGLLIGISNFWSAFHWSVIPVHASIPLSFLYYAVLLTVLSGGTFSLLKKRVRAKIPAFAVAVILLINFWSPILANGFRSDFEVFFFDVGQADAALIRTRSNLNIVVDTGRKDGPLLKHLARKNVGKIDMLMLSHLEEDHAGKAAEVLQKYRVGSLILPRPEVEKERGYLWKRVSATAKSRGVKIIFAKKGQRLHFENVWLEIFNPAEGSVLDTNNDSVVAKVTHEDISVLFTGDIEKEAEDVLENETELDSDVIKVPHHGAGGSADVEFMEMVSPGYAIISAGRKNPYGHPAPKTIGMLKKQKINIFRTDLNGTIRLRSDGRDLAIEPERS